MAILEPLVAPAVFFCKNPSNLIVIRSFLDLASDYCGNRFPPIVNTNQSGMNTPSACTGKHIPMVSLSHTAA